MFRSPSVFIAAKDVGGPLRVEIDGGGGNRTYVDVEVLKEDQAGGQTVVHSERVYVGDGPIEWIGPHVDHHWRGGAIRVRIKDIGTQPPIGSGPTIADDSAKIRNS